MWPIPGRPRHWMPCWLWMTHSWCNIPHNVVNNKPPIWEGFIPTISGDFGDGFLLLQLQISSNIIPFRSPGCWTSCTSLGTCYVSMKSDSLLIRHRQPLFRTCELFSCVVMHLCWIHVVGYWIGGWNHSRDAKHQPAQKPPCLQSRKWNVNLGYTPKLDDFHWFATQSQAGKAVPLYYLVTIGTVFACNNVWSYMLVSYIWFYISPFISMEYKPILPRYTPNFW